MNTIDYDRRNRQLITHRVPVCSSPLDIPDSRNMQVKGLLQTDCEWLWFIDSDMGFDIGTLYTLLDTAGLHNRDIIGALCPSYRVKGPDGLGGWTMEKVSVAYIYRDGSFWQIPSHSIPSDSLIDVDGTGTAMLLVHRSVFENLAEWENTGENWFTRASYDNGVLISEDLSFCYRYRMSTGKKIGVHTGIPISHHKQVWLQNEIQG